MTRLCPLRQKSLFWVTGAFLWLAMGSSSRCAEPSTGADQSLPVLESAGPRAKGGKQPSLAPANAPDLQKGKNQWNAPWPGAFPYKRNGLQGSWRFTTITTLDSWMKKKGTASLPETEDVRSSFFRRGTGFYSLVQERNRWWFLDPGGKLFISTGVNNLRPSLGAADQASTSRFSTQADWAQKEAKRVQDWGFNTAGCWSQVELLRTQGTGLAYTVIRWPGWEANTGPLAAFAIERDIGGRGLGNRQYPRQVAPIFHPDFPAFVEKHAPALSRYANDRNLLGYFLDNEIPHPELGSYLGASSTDEGQRGARDAALKWLADRGRTPQTQTEADRAEWSGYVFDTYCRLVVTAIRKHDPHHLILGPRLHARSLTSAATFKAVGQYCDVISVHPYGTLIPERQQFANWSTWSGRPVLITEFYAKGDDLRFNNRNGAGILVPNQEMRGRYYQAYTLSCLAAPTCIGWHWHFYRDLNPSSAAINPDVDVSVNKGLVNHEFEPYDDCILLMSRLNQRVYSIAGFEAGPPQLGWVAVTIYSLLGISLVALLWLLLRRPLYALVSKYFVPHFRHSTSSAS